MTLEQLQSDCLGLLAAVEPAAAAAQAGYRAARGHYCQLPLPMDQIPADGELVACDWSRYVSDVQFPWTASPVELPAQLPCGIQYQVFQTHADCYYVAVLSIRWEGTLYQYRRTYNASGLANNTGWLPVWEES